MNNDLIKKILNDNQQLFSLPQTLVEVLRVTRDENSSAQQLADVLMKDPALTTKLLRVVNSPYYGASREVSSVSQAIVMVGMRQVTALALCTSIYRLTNNWRSSLDRVRFWRHSLSVAIASRTIAEKSGFRNLEEVFVSGLLHDIGLLIIENSFPDEFRRVWKEAARRGGLIDLEEECWGTNHARVGQFLLEQWQLPESICEAVGCHHNVFLAGTTAPEFVGPQIVNLANRISQLQVIDRRQAIPELERDDRDIILNNLGLSTDDLLYVERNILSQTIQESKYLEVDVGSTEDLLAESNSILFKQYAAVETLLDENRRLQRQTSSDNVKRGFLEAFKDATSTLTRYVDRSNALIITRARQVQSALESGAIVDPDGLVASSVASIIENIVTVDSLVEEFQGLTGADGTFNYDPSHLKTVGNRLNQELERIREPVETV